MTGIRFSHKKTVKTKNVVLKGVTFSRYLRRW